MLGVFHGRCYAASCIRWDSSISFSAWQEEQYIECPDAKFEACLGILFFCSEGHWKTSEINTSFKKHKWPGIRISDCPNFFFLGGDFFRFFFKTFSLELLGTCRNSACTWALMLQRSRSSLLRLASRCRELDLRFTESGYPQGSLNYPFAGNQTMQMYGNFDWFPS